MCGINGFSYPDTTQIRAMNDDLHHRGPDDHGEYIDEGISLGSTRLAIIDLSQNGHMPMTDMSGRFVIVFNGEIYNFKTLRQHLQQKGYKFRSQSDTEVVVNLYAEYGTDSFKELNGMFAFGIWDKQFKRLTIARDRIGIKPLYYAYDSKQFLFSSEIKPLYRNKKVSRKINPKSLELYLRLLYVPSPLTMYQDVNKVEPGQYVTWGNNSIHKEYYWTPNIAERCDSKERILNELSQVIHESVKDQLVLSDRSVGVFLSGGIDSNIVLNCAAKSTKNQINTFTIRFSEIAEESKFNADAELAKKSAAFYNANHHEIDITPQKALDDFLHILPSFDSPIANATHIPTYELAKGSSQTITVALGGDGGDEIFGGYDRYLNAMWLDYYQRIPRVLRHSFTDKFLFKIKQNPNEYFLENLQAETTVKKYLAFMGQDEGELQKIHQSNVQTTLSELKMMRGFNSTLSFYKQFSLLDLLHWLPEESLSRSDKMTMLSSLEQRVPLLDNRVVDVGLSLPFSYKVGIQQRKIILRNTFARELPDYICNAPKRGFFSPAAKWIRHPAWQSLITELFEENCIRNFGIYNSKMLKIMLNEHISGKKYNMQHIWAALTLHGWMKTTGAYL